MRLSNGKKFTMTAEGLSSENMYIQAARLNGEVWNKPYLPYDEMKNGGTIVFTMGPEPNRAWGSSSDIPH
jgi:putative alpha-1,2-mannosidase